MRTFRRSVVAQPGLDAFREAAADYEVMLVTILDAVLARFEHHGGRYPFIDTKLSIITGEDFAEPADVSRDFKGRSAVLSWIQGRGLEALVGHARWLPECSVLGDAGKAGRIARLRDMIAAVFERMETLRARNGGKLFFMMTPEGEPFDTGADGWRRPIDIRGSRSRMSDLFYAKGMLAAADLLGRADKVDEAKRYFRAVLADAEAERFERDAIAFDPGNPALVAPPAQLPHAPRMISIGGCVLFAELTGESEWLDAGARIVQFLLERHANLGQFAELRPGDFFEFRDAAGQPFKEPGNVVRSDPGHSLEFVGLAAKLALMLPAGSPLRARCADALPKLFARNFANGFNPGVGGIVKHVDLVSRRALNPEMPWWNLPETMRAAAELLVLAPDAPERAEILSALMQCSNGFMASFVNPSVHLMAYQTVGPDGRPVDVVPATPDADPGYHTGLSLIDMLRRLRSLR